MNKALEFVERHEHQWEKRLERQRVALNRFGCIGAVAWAFSLLIIFGLVIAPIIVVIGLPAALWDEFTNGAERPL
jgi:hypothetical protein